MLERIINRHPGHGALDWQPGYFQLPSGGVDAGQISAVPFDGVRVPDPVNLIAASTVPGLQTGREWMDCVVQLEGAGYRFFRL